MGFSKHKLLKGTFILTITGFITRIIGFIYKIYLADILGAKMLGMYQLIFPVYAVCFTIYGAGIQTAISQVIAADLSRNRKSAHSGRILKTGTLLSLSLALSLCLLVYIQAEWIAIHFVMEPALAPYLRIMALLFPFCSVSACINGYYYGIQEAKVPAIAQMVEQVVRVAFVLLSGMVFTIGASPEQGCIYAVWGLVAGEAAASLYNMYQLSRSQSADGRIAGVFALGVPLFRRRRLPQAGGQGHSSHAIRTLLWLSATLTLTRLLVSFLNSAESILLPAMLRSYGCSSADALSIYGVLTGMSMSFILFPSTITHSFAVMLLPSIADAYARQDTVKIRQSITMSIKYCILIGLLCTCLFLILGRELGLVFFHSEDAGNYLVVLAWLCPFLYLGTTLTSVINGMEKTQVTFFYTIVSLGIKITVLTAAVPVFGIRAYLAGLLASQLLLVLLECLYLRHYIHMDAVRWILIPSLALSGLGLLAESSYACFQNRFSGWHAVIPMAAAAGIVCLGYCAVLYMAGIVNAGDLSS